MSIGGGDLIEVGHPTPRSGLEDPRMGGRPVLHLGPVAAGRGVALDDQLRQEFAYKNGILAYDSELDSVVEVRPAFAQLEGTDMLFNFSEHLRQPKGSLHVDPRDCRLQRRDKEEGVATVCCAYGSIRTQVHHCEDGPDVNLKNYVSSPTKTTPQLM